MENYPEKIYSRFTRRDRLPVIRSEVSSRRSAFFAAVLVGCLCTLTGIFNTAFAKDGSFEIRSASTRLNDGVYFATARIDYRLSSDALAALDSGVALTVQLQIELSRKRRFWPDNDVATLSQAYSLSFQPLSDRYVVKNLNSGEQDSFATLFSALNNMGRVVDLPVIDVALLDPDLNYEIALRAVLDQNTLPGPLRLIAFWSSGFRLASDWYRWPLND